MNKIFGIYVDASEIIDFVSKYLDMKWNDVCDLEREVNGDESSNNAYYSYEPKPKKNETENEKKFREAINAFIEKHNLSKTESFLSLFTD